jgi:CxxC-x17-CxxC domain-containing protein
MKNFRDNKGGFGGAKREKPSFQHKSWGVDRGQAYGGDRDKPLYKAVCSECGKSCEVPFRPSGDKPVFCSDCFNKKRDPSDTRGGKRDFNDRHAPRQDSRQEYSRPADPRAPYKPAPVNNDDTKRALSEISMKLDRLISAMEKMAQPMSAPKSAPVVVPVSKKVEIKKSPVVKTTPKKVVAPKTAKKKVVSKKK